MRFCLHEEGEAAYCRQKSFSLPFVNDRIQLDDAGARLVAWLACRMAVANSGPLETEGEYARRMAVFVCGIMASECGSDVQRLRIFEDFLPLAAGYLHRTCSHCLDETSDEEALDAMIQNR